MDNTRANELEDRLNNLEETGEELLVTEEDIAVLEQVFKERKAQALRPGAEDKDFDSLDKIAKALTTAKQIRKDKQEEKQAQEEAQAKAQVKSKNRFPSMADYRRDRWQKDMAEGKRMVHYKTGLKPLDNALHGFAPGLYVLGGVSRMGKTTFALQLADNVASPEMGENRRHVLFFSYEQEEHTLMSKSLARIGAKMKEKFERENVVTASDIMRGDWVKEGVQDEQEWKEVEDRYNALAPYLHIYKDGIPGVLSHAPNVTEIEATVKEFRDSQKEGETPPVVIIDYLQIVPPPPANAGRQLRERVDAVLEVLAQFKSKYKTPVLLLSQLSRDSYDTPSRLNAFRESSLIENCADCALILELFQVEAFKGTEAFKTRETNIADTEMREPVRDMRLKCVKFKMGPQFDIRLDYYSNCDLFEQSERKDEPGDKYKQGQPVK